MQFSQSRQELLSKSKLSPLSHEQDLLGVRKASELQVLQVEADPSKQAAQPATSQCSQKPVELMVWLVWKHWQFPSEST